MPPAPVRLLAAEEACRQTGLDPAELEQAGAAPLTRIFADGRREQAYQVPVGLIDPGAVPVTFWSKHQGRTLAEVFERDPAFVERLAYGERPRSQQSVELQAAARAFLSLS